MKKVLVALIAGSILSGVAAYAAIARPTAVKTQHVVR